MRSEWSRVGSGSSTRVQPGAFSPASSTADFTCADATGSRYSIGMRVPSAADGERQAPALAAGELRAAERQRLRHAAHRAAAQARVAGHHREQVVAGQDAAQQPGGGARIAHVEHVVRLAQPADAAAGDAPLSRAVARHLGARAPAWRRPCAGRPRPRAGR